MLGGVIGIIGLFIIILSFPVMSGFGGSIDPISSEFYTGCAMFLFGLIILFLGCKKLKNQFHQSMLLSWGLTAVSVVSLIIFFLSVGFYHWEPSPAENMIEQEQQNKQEEKDNSTTWNYTNAIDDLTGNITSINAAIASTNSLTLNDGSTDRLVIQLSYNAISTSGEPSNMFGIAFKKGNLRFANKRSQGFLAVFDNGEVDNTWSICNGGNDKAIVMISDKVSGSDHLINSFINKLKNAKTCRIQVNVDGAGMKTFDFNCEGLQWEY